LGKCQRQETGQESDGHPQMSSHNAAHEIKAGKEEWSHYGSDWNVWVEYVHCVVFKSG
jgi:hypothetical protein